MPDEQRLLELTRRVAELVAAHSLDELTVDEDGLRVTVRAVVDAPAPHPAGVVLPAGNPLPLLARAETPPPSPLPSEGRGRQSDVSEALPFRGGGLGGGSPVALLSPMVGVFYLTPTPEDPPFVSVGDTIKVGQTVGLIEAMKVYSELPSDVAGRIVRIAAQNGALVQEGQPLLYVEAA